MPTLSATDAATMIAVRDLAVARRFYQDILDLEPVDEEDDEVVVFASGATRINVYRSQYAGTNRATTLTWEVEDCAAAVRELAAKGVSFERYDLPGMERDGDIHRCGGMRLAWFKDPDGNILSILSHERGG